RPTHPASRAQEFIAHGGGGKRHIELPAQLHREDHILLHHVHVETSFFRLLQNERPTVLNHGRSDCTVSKNIDGDLTLNAAFLSEQHTFRERQHLHRETQIGRNLHGKSQSVVAYVSNLWADIEQERLDLFESLFPAADHYGE